MRAMPQTPAQVFPPRDDDLYKCVHCGLCLNVCPTYLETGLETESPRGRIALMKAVREERVGFTDYVVPHMEMCLQCRACEIACPSGVPFGRLMEVTRAQLKLLRKGPRVRRFLLWLVFRHLLPHQRRLYFAGRLFRLYQRSPVGRLLTRVPGVIGELHRQIPTLPRRFFHTTSQSFEPVGFVKATVGLLSGCIMPIVHANTMEAGVRVLLRNGCRVEVPLGQLCCGALNLHGGDRDQARSMARRNIDVFLNAGIDKLVVLSAGCGSTMKEYDELLTDDPFYAEKARQFSSMVVDITEYLAGLPLDAPAGKLSTRVTYQDACHLAHAQRITAAPRQVLQSIPGLEFVEMDNSSRCCGAAGLYSSLQPSMSKRLLGNKICSVVDVEADVVATTNPGCMIQLESGLKRTELNPRVCHIVDLLDEAYRLESEVPLS